MPSVEIKLTSRNIVDILVTLNLAKSKGEAKRLIDGGGVKVNDMVIGSYDYEIGESEFNNGFTIHKGKKVHIKVTII